MSDKQADSVPVRAGRYKRRNNWLTDIEAFECECTEAFECFLEGFTIESGLIRKPTNEDTGFDVPIEWYYTHRGSVLASRFLNRLYKLANKIFGEAALWDAGFDIKTNLFVEP
jgi:hypothetical protein